MRMGPGSNYNRTHPMVKAIAENLGNVSARITTILGTDDKKPLDQEALDPLTKLVVVRGHLLAQLTQMTSNVTHVLSRITIEEGLSS